MKLTWALLSGEYPPQEGGVSDYTRLVARGLAREGDLVHVFAPACPGATPSDPGVTVHRLPGGFGLRALRGLGKTLETLPKDRRILVQYVPHAFGWKAMNVPFCSWLRMRNDPVWVMFHEVAFPRRPGQPLKHDLLASVTRFMARLALEAAERVFVSIPAWEPVLRSLGSPRGPVTWLPIPSMFPTSADPAKAREHRSRLVPGASAVLGHFGTFGEASTSLLREILPPILVPGRVALLFGRGGEAFVEGFVRAHPELARYVRATGGLAESDVTDHLAGCDLLVQPYPDGVSTRRTSVMAGLAPGLPIVANEGDLTEPIWRETGGVSLVGAPTALAFSPQVSRLLDAPEARTSLGERARKLYAERFAIERTIAVLRGEG